MTEMVVSNTKRLLTSENAAVAAKRCLRHTGGRKEEKEEEEKSEQAEGKRQHVLLRTFVFSSHHILTKYPEGIIEIYSFREIAAFGDAYLIR